MGQTSEQIKQEIDSQRQALGENLQHLEERVKTTVDWRAQFEQRPMVGIGAAFATGFLLSALMPGGSESSSSSRSSYRGYGTHGSSQDMSNYRVRDEATAWQQPTSSSQQSYSPPTQSSQSSQSSDQSQGFLGLGGGGGKAPEMSEIAETIDSVRGALMGLAATRLRSFLAEAIPGFADEYEQARKSRGGSEATRLTYSDSSSNSSNSSSSSSDRSSSTASRSGSGSGRSGDSDSTGSSNWQQGSSTISGESGPASDNPLSDVSHDRGGLNPGPLPAGTTTNRGDDATYRP